MLGWIFYAKIQGLPMCKIYKLLAGYFKSLIRERSIFENLIHNQSKMQENITNFSNCAGLISTINGLIIN